MMAVPESALDYLIVSKDEALALEEFFEHEFVNQDRETVHAFLRKLSAFNSRHRIAAATGGDSVDSGLDNFVSGLDNAANGKPDGV